MFNKIINKIKENLLFITIFIVCIFVFSYEFPYYIMGPGGTIDISNRVKVDGKDDTDGSLNLLYVANYKGTLPMLVLSKLLKDWDIEKQEAAKISDESYEEVNLRNKYLLDNSISNAIHVAYSHSDKKMDIIGRKNVVIGLTSDNNSNLKIGDLILKVDGIEVENINTIKNIIKETDKEKLVFTIIRNNKEMDIEAIINETDNTKSVGVVMITNYEYELDPKINLNFKKSESGSSGGLMLALSIYNKISDIDLIMGRKIAGTGTIELDGSVGEIGGIKYKLIGAVKEKIDVMLVAADNYDECIELKKENNYKIEIVRIETFEDALEYLSNTR